MTEYGEHVLSLTAKWREEEKLNCSRVLGSTVSLQHLSVTPILNADHLIKKNKETELVGQGNKRGGVLL